MNVSSPRKSRVPHPKDNQQSGISGLPTEPLIENNSIPKQHVGVEQSKQLGFDPEVGRIFSPIGRKTYFDEEDDLNIPFKTYIRIDEDPFNLLPEDLFDTPLSEGNVLNGPETNDSLVNKPNAETSKSIGSNLGIEKEQEDICEKCAPQDGSSLPPSPKCKWIQTRPVADHPLIKPMAEKWLKSNKWVGLKFSKKKSYINKFIRFLVHEKVQIPTKEHILLYYQALINDPEVNYPEEYVSGVRAFFRWAKVAGLYENITQGTESQIYTYKRYVGQEVQSRQRLSTFQPIIAMSRRATITIDDMVNAQFGYNQATYLINNDLKVFKQWVEILDFASKDAQRKVLLLKFAYFLYSENRTTPTQQDIIDYYKQYLMQLSANMINNSMVTIRHFFTWTERRNIYPNIAVNTCLVRKKSTNSDDIIILLPQKNRKFIPNPTSPLINKTI